MDSRRRNAAIAGGIAALALAGLTTGTLALTTDDKARSVTTTSYVPVQPGFAQPQFAQAVPKVGEDFAPEPAEGWDLRVPLVSCGVQKTFSLAAEDIVLIVNTGIVARWIDPVVSGPPIPSWEILPGDWFTFSFAEPGTYRLNVQHATCSKAYAQRLTFVVA